MADLLGSDFGLAEAHKLYACHDLLLAHKEAVAVGAARQTREHERDARGDADEAGSGAIEGADRVALGRRHARQGERRADLLPQSPEIAYREAAGGALSAAHQSDQPGSCPPMAVLHSTRRRGGGVQNSEGRPGDPPDLPS